MDYPEISIIMPVYNVEKYISQSIESVLNQTYKSFRLILVDDCSTDKSGEICEDYASRDSRITVIRKTVNEGLSAARNTGTEAASGRFILFIDSDDSLEKQALEKAIEAAGSNDITVFGVNRIFEDEAGNVIKAEHLTVQEGVLTPDKAFIALTKAKIFNFAWNKLYSREFIESMSLRFENVRLIEDFVFNIAAFANAKSIGLIGECLYNYRRPAHQTLVNTYAPEFFELAKRKYLSERALLEKFNAADDSNVQVILFSYIKHLFSVFIRNNSAKANLSAPEQKGKIKSALSDGVTESVLKEYSPPNIVFSILKRVLQKKRVALVFLLVTLYGKISK